MALRQNIHVDGISYSTAVEGPTDGPVVVLIHALMANLTMWDETVPELNSLGYRTIRWDNIGHGRSSYAPALNGRNWTFDDFTEHIREITRKALGRDHVSAIIGCSMGGVLALRCAMKYPGFVDKILSCDAPGLTSLEQAKPLWRERMQTFAKGPEGHEELVRATANRWLPVEAADSKEERIEHDSIRARTYDMVKTCSYSGYCACAEGIMSYNYTGELGNIVDHKVMILIGSHDNSIGPREVSEGIAQRVGRNGCPLVIIPGAGHLPPMQQPGLFNSIMSDFLGPAVDVRSD